MKAKILVTDKSHIKFADQICLLIEESASKRGTGIAKRNPEYIRTKIVEHKAIIALINDDVAGFCYIEKWQHNRYVANSGLIVADKYRGLGLAKEIKKRAFNLSRKLYPEAKIFGLTTSLAVMKINSSLGYNPVTFSELTNDDLFWKGCESCVNYDILMRTNKNHCLCTAMLFDSKKKNKTKTQKPLKVFGRWLRFKKNVLLKKNKKL